MDKYPAKSGVVLAVDLAMRAAEQRSEARPKAGSRSRRRGCRD